MILALGELLTALLALFLIRDMARKENARVKAEGKRWKKN